MTKNRTQFDAKQMLGTGEAAELLGVSDFTIRDWIRSGRLVAYKFARNYRIRRSDLEAFQAQARYAARAA